MTNARDKTRRGRNAGESAPRASPNLPARVKLACRFLAGALDADRRDTPFFYIRTDASDRCYLDHVFWYDTCHVPGRCLDAMLNAAHVFGVHVDETAVDRFARAHKRGLRGFAGFAGYVNPETGEKCIGFHNLRESLLGLLALMRFRDDARAHETARRLISAAAALFDDEGEVKPAALARLGRRFTCKSLDGAICYTAGRFIGALVKYGRHTGEAEALELARRLADLCLRQAFHADGSLGDRAGRHVHSITATVNGLIDLGRLLDDERYVRGGRRVYGVGLQELRSSFGWFTESRGREDNLGEANSTADAIQAAVLLGRCGSPQYFEDAERMLHGHLLPSQLLDARGFEFHSRPKTDAERVTPERLSGGWGLASVNEQVMAGWPYVATYDNTAGPVQGLCELWQAVVTEDETGVRLNLFLDHDAVLARVSASLPESGQVTVKMRVAKPLSVRLPAGLLSSEVTVAVDGRKTPCREVHGYLQVGGGRAGRTIVLEFPVKTRQTGERINGTHYRAQWRGSRVIALSPAGERLPMFPGVDE